MNNMHPKMEERIDDVLAERVDQLASALIDVMVMTMKTDLAQEKTPHGIIWAIESAIKCLIREKAILESKSSVGGSPIDDLLHNLADLYRDIEEDLKK